MDVKEGGEEDDRQKTKQAQKEAVRDFVVRLWWEAGGGGGGGGGGGVTKQHCSTSNFTHLSTTHVHRSEGRLTVPVTFILLLLHLNPLPRRDR